MRPTRMYPDGLPPILLSTVKTLLRERWDLVDFNYDALPVRERDTMTRAQFVELCLWVKK